MTDVSDRHRRLAADFTRTLEQVPADRWDSPSPCAGWTALDVARHVAETPALFLRMVGREPAAGPPADQDVHGAWATARDQVQADLDDPERRDAGFDGFFGRSTFGEAIGRFVCFDLVVHRWDLARAAELDDRLDPADVADLWTVAQAFGDTLRGDGVCGPAVQALAGADEQTRVLAYLGREV